MALQKNPSLTPALQAEFDRNIYLWDFAFALGDLIRNKGSYSTFVVEQRRQMLQWDAAAALAAVPEPLPPTQPEAGTSTSDAASRNNTDVGPEANLDPPPHVPHEADKESPPTLTSLEADEDDADPMPTPPPAPKKAKKLKSAEPPIPTPKESNAKRSVAATPAAASSRASTAGKQKATAAPTPRTSATPAAAAGPSTTAAPNADADADPAAKPKRKPPVNSGIKYGPGCDACIGLNVDCWVQCSEGGSSCYKCSKDKHKCSWDKANALGREVAPKARAALLKRAVELAASAQKAVQEENSGSSKRKNTAPHDDADNVPTKKKSKKTQAKVDPQAESSVGAAKKVTFVPTVEMPPAPAVVKVKRSKKAKTPAVVSSESESDTPIISARSRVAANVAAPAAPASGSEFEPSTSKRADKKKKRDASKGR